MLNESIEELDRKLQKFYEKNFLKRDEELRTLVSDNPTQYTDDLDLSRLKIWAETNRSLIGLAVMSWYTTPEIGSLLNLQLGETRLNGRDYELMEILLTSKSFALSWLILQDEWNDFDFWGNVLDTRLVRIWDLTEFVKKSRRKVRRYTGYCRGYRDSSRRNRRLLDGSLLAKSEVRGQLERETQRAVRTFIWRRKIESFLENQTAC